MILVGTREALIAFLRWWGLKILTKLISSNHGGFEDPLIPTMRC